MSSGIVYDLHPLYLFSHLFYTSTNPGCSFHFLYCIVGFFRGGDIVCLCCKVLQQKAVLWNGIRVGDLFVLV